MEDKEGGKRVEGKRVEGNRVEGKRGDEERRGKEERKGREEKNRKGVGNGVYIFTCIIQLHTCYYILYMYRPGYRYSVHVHMYLWVRQEQLSVVRLTEELANITILSS